MDNTIISSIIAAASAILSAYFTSKWTSKSNKDDLKEQLKQQLQQQTESLKHSTNQQRKKLVADDISKSRIEWLNITRKYISDYMSEVNRCWDYGQQYQRALVEIQDLAFQSSSGDDSSINYYSEQIASLKEKLPELLNKRNDILKIAESDYYKSIFSVNPDERIRCFIDQYLVLTQLKPMANLDQKNAITEIVGDEMQKYFKREWDKAKFEIVKGKVYKADDDKENTQFFNDSLKKLYEHKSPRYFMNNTIYKRPIDIQKNKDAVEQFFGKKSSESKLINILYEIK